MRLADLVRRLLDETPVERLRLSSVEPMDFSDDLLALMASSPRIAKHVHAPLQSGSDTVLRRMHRKYRPRHYADRIAKARALMPDCAVGADVMTGFPGETDAEFERLPRVHCESAVHLFARVHLFGASRHAGRGGDAGSDGRSQAPNPCVTRARRTKEFGISALDDRTDHFRRHAGNGGALSDNYVKVALSTPRAANRIEEIRIGGLTKDGVCEAGTLPECSDSLQGGRWQAGFERKQASFHHRESQFQIGLSDLDIVHSRVLAFGVAMKFRQQVGFNLPHGINKLFFLRAHRFDKLAL